MTDETALIVRPNQTDGPMAIIPRTFAEAKEMAEYLGKSGLLPAAMNKGPAAVYAIVAAGAEIGLPPMAALRAFYINTRTGTPALYAEAQTAIVVSRSDICEYLYPVEQTATRATWATKRRGHPAEVRASWDIDRAKKAGLDTKDTYKAHPARMLSARAKSDLCRDIYPDIVGGLRTEYDDDEIIADVGGVEVFARAPAATPEPAPAAAPKRGRPPNAAPTPSNGASPSAAPPAQNSPPPVTQTADKTGLVTPATGPAAAARTDYEASAARVAAAAAPPAPPEVIDAEIVDEPGADADEDFAGAAEPAIPSELAAFFAALKESKDEPALKAAKAKAIPWSKTPAGNLHASAMQEAYIARFQAIKAGAAS